MLTDRLNQGIDRNLVASFKSKDDSIIKSLSAKNKRSLDSIDKLVLALSNTKSETVVNSINKQIAQYEEQIQSNIESINKANTRISNIDSFLASLPSLDAEVLFQNTTLTNEVIGTLAIEVKVDTKIISITIGEGE
jgi:hypothetical protein